MSRIEIRKFEHQYVIVLYPNKTHYGHHLFITKKQALELKNRIQDYFD